jgi:hypothetical protein
MYCNTRPIQLDINVVKPAYSWLYLAETPRAFSTG